jgi:NTP pyrophosphatase (non-canonical NTP hydrolase)
MTKETDDIIAACRRLTEFCHGASRDGGWYTNPYTGEEMDRNVGEMMMLIVSEVAEAMEGHRKDLCDTHLPCRLAVEVELADAVIRICDLAGHLGLDLGSAIAEKVEFNRHRADHKIENRTKAGGKKF